MLIAGACFVLLASFGEIVLIFAGVLLAGVAASANALALKPTRDEFRSVLRRIQRHTPVSTAA